MCAYVFCGASTSGLRRQLSSPDYLLLKLLSLSHCCTQAHTRSDGHLLYSLTPAQLQTLRQHQVMSSTAALIVKIAYVVTISRSLHMWDGGSWGHSATTLFQPELVTNNVINDEVNLARSSLPLLTRRRDDNKCV